MMTIRGPVVLSLLLLGALQGAVCAADEDATARYQGRPLTIGEEATMLLRAGVNGFFIDQPSEGRLAVDRLRLEAGSRL